MPLPQTKTYYFMLHSLFRYGWSHKLIMPSAGVRPSFSPGLLWSFVEFKHVEVLLYAGNLTDAYNDLATALEDSVQGFVDQNRNGLGMIVVMMMVVMMTIGWTTHMTVQRSGQRLLLFQLMKRMWLQILDNLGWLRTCDKFLAITFTCSGRGCRVSGICSGLLLCSRSSCVGAGDIALGNWALMRLLRMLLLLTAVDNNFLVAAWLQCRYFTGNVL